MEEDPTKIPPAGSGVSTIRRCARAIALQKHSRKLSQFLLPAKCSEYMGQCFQRLEKKNWRVVANIKGVIPTNADGSHQQKTKKNHINCLSSSFFILKSHTIYSQIQHAYQNTLYFCLFYQIQPLAKRSTKCQVNRPLWTEGLLSLLRSCANSRTEEFRFVP